MPQARKKKPNVRIADDEEEQNGDEQVEEEDDEGAEEPVDEGAEDDEQADEEEQPVDPEPEPEPDQEGDQEEGGLQNLTLSITEDTIAVTLPRDGEEAQVLKRLAKFLGGED